MQLSWWIRLRSVFYALSLHIVAAVLLVFSFSFTKPIIPPHQNINIVNAVTVDKAQVEKELQRLKKIEEDRNLAEKKRVEELQKQAEAEKKKADGLKQQRQEEEKKLLEAKKKKEQEQKQREEEQKKLVQLEKEKQELEKQRKLEEEKKKKAEEEKYKKEKELKRQEEERRKAEAERKRHEAEENLQKQLAEEQQQQDLTLLEKVTAAIYNKVTSKFNQTGLPEGLSCALRVRLLPGGEVIDVSVSKSSGNDIFDRRAQTAVHQASPLPVPEDIATFERLNLRDITFTFKP